MIKNYILNNDENIRIQSMIIFSNLINNYYKYFESFMGTLIDTLIQILDKDTEKSKKACIDILLTIGEYENYLINSTYKICTKFFFFG